MLSLTELIREHDELVARLRRFSFADAARLVSGLAVCPQLHGNTIRIDALAHLVAVSCHGKDIPSSKNLVEWASKWMSRSSVARQEDPLEDVFVGCVTCAAGSFRVLGGNTSDKDFWVERLLELIEGKQEFPPFRTGLEEAIELLKLSEALVDRLALPRYSKGSGNAAGRIIIPTRDEMAECFEAVVFTETELTELGLSLVKLGRFVLTEELRAKIKDETLWNSALCRHPLWKSSDGVVILAPSSIVRALESQLLDCILNTGLGNWTEYFFKVNCATTFVNDVAPRLEIKPSGFIAPPPPKGMPTLLPFYGEFDIGKPAILLTYCPSLAGSFNDVDGCDVLGGDEMTALMAHLDAYAMELEKQPEFSGGLVLFNLVSFRYLLFGAPIWRKRWQIHMASLPDWLILTAHGECTAMRLWRMGQQEDRLQRRGTRIMNMAGLVNLYGFWSQNKFRLLRRDVPRETNILNIACDFSLNVRANSLQREDFHSVQSHDRKTMIQIVRHNARSLFTEDSEVNLYVAPSEVRRHRNLVGCIEEGVKRWWIVTQGKEGSAELRDLIYQVWDCTFNWVGRVAQFAFRRWPDIWPESLEINIVLDADENFHSYEDYQNLPLAELVLSVEPSTKSAKLELPRGFLGYFQIPKNVAETKIVNALILLTTRSVGITLTDEELVRATREIIRNDDARYFHMFETTDLAHLLTDSSHPKPLFVDDDDMACAHEHLVALLDTPGFGEINGLDPSLKLLKDAVDKLWADIERQLSLFDHESVLAGCLTALVEVDRDAAQWDLTTRSLIAMHNDMENTHEVIHDRRADRSRSSLANRLLLEVAQYAPMTETGRTMTNADHRDLLSQMLLLLEMAHHRDAISYGFMDPKVTRHPNGEIGVDEKFYIEVVGKYFTQRSLERTKQAAERYDRYFRKYTKNEPSNEETSQAILNLDRVFVPEFGFSVTMLFDLRDLLCRFAGEAKVAGGQFDEATFSSFFAECGFTETEGAAFLDRFTLPRRSAWNRQLPPRCSEHDVFPWRFRRQLSLLARPLIELTTAPRTWYVSVPLFDRAVDYFISRVSEGDFPEAFFHSLEMRQYVGNQAHKRGHDYAKEVGQFFSAAGFKTKLELEMSTLGASKKEGLGDIDVLAWDSEKSCVFVIECKCLRSSGTIREIVQRLEDFKGKRKEKDSLGRHLRRIDWVGSHLDAIRRYTGITNAKLRIVPLLVTNETVPMQFFKEMAFPTDQVVPLAELAKRI